VSSSSQPPDLATLPTAASHRIRRRPRDFVTWLIVLSACLLGVFGRHAPAHAHESAPGVLALKEVSDGRYLALWTNPMPPVEDIVVHLPAPCTIAGNATFGYRNAPVVPSAMECGGQLAGEVRFTSETMQLGPIGVNVEWRDGSQSMHLSDGPPQRVALGGLSHGGGTGSVLVDYGLLGVEHILWGVDHLLFLLGLLLLARGWKDLLATISAFTAAHSITLAAASLELVDVSIAPVEISIALSVLLLAVEVAQPSQTVTRRWPWLVAFCFGLLHGLGFASALSEVGLPRHAVAMSLLGFNLGVEAGQLCIVGCVFGAYRLLASKPESQRRVEWISVGALASCSTFWLLQRIAAWLEAFG
jgi:hydrogenase/urease accessory protein HupE